MALPVLRPYQMDAVTRAAARVNSGLRRGIIQGECGSGKSMCIGYMVWRAFNKNSRVLILTDRRKLVKQLKAVLDAFEVPNGTIMSGESENTGARVILASRDTLISWYKNGKTVPLFDLVITDECHRNMAPTVQALLAKYPDAVVVGFTATPAREDGKSLGSFFEWIECMVPASQLIADGWLIKPEVYSPPELTKKRKKGAKVKGLAGDPVTHWKRHAKGLPTIAFCSKVSESIKLVERFREANIKAEHISAKVSDVPDPETGLSDRDQYYLRLAKGETQVLCSVGLLIEGVDIPEVSCILMWCKCGSMVKWRQGAGRGMRPAPGKTRCVILDHSGAVGMHGLPGEDVEWSLDLGSTLANRRKKAIEEGRLARPVTCRACGLAFSGTTDCPACGWKIPESRTSSAPGGGPSDTQEAQDEILSRYRDGEAFVMDQTAMDRYWRSSIYIAIARNGTCGLAAQIFQKKCKMPPWQAKVKPLPPNRSDWRRPCAEIFPRFVKVRI